ncbi:MAG: protein kinase [Myxococcales bacterium]|nr:protein kinase [Myxococcales bacterium]
MPDERDPAGSDATVAVGAAAVVAGADATVAAPGAAAVVAGTAATVAVGAAAVVAGADGTVAASGAAAVVAGTDATVAASGGGPGREATLAAPVAPVVLGDSLVGAAVTLSPTDAGATTARTIGDDLRAASIDRFDEVARDRFELLGELARGGLGRVFRARDPRTGRVVALKEVLRPTADLMVRFAREAMVTANLQHPAIVPVYEVGRWPSGEPFYAMKLVRGRALDALIAEATTPAARIALLPHVIAIAEALAYAHSERVIHRDLKPANVLVGPYGETVVIDWGLARNLGDAETASGAPVAVERAEPGMTVVGAVVGTPAYMAPEQAAGQPLDERADVYAIGAILYHVLGGERPYAECRTIEQILAAVDAGPPRSLRVLAPTLPAELVTIAEHALARAPADRYATAAGLAEDLRRFQTGQLVGAHRYTRWQRIRRWVGQHRGAVGTGAVALAALAVFAILSVTRIARERDRARGERTIAQRERARAEQAQALAEQRVGETLEELGRQALIAGEPERALPFLAAATGAGPRPTLAALLGEAAAPFTGLRALAPPDVVGTLAADLVDGGHLLVAASAMGASAYDLATRRPVWTAPGVHHVRASPDGALVLCLGPGLDVTIRTAHEGRVVRRWTLPAADDQLWLPAWSPRGDRLAVATGGGRVATGGLDDAALAVRGAHQGEVWTLAFSPDGARLMSVGADGVIAIAGPDGTARTIAQPSIKTIAAAWLDDRSLLAVADDGEARTWRVDGAAPPRVTRRFTHGRDPYGVYVAPTGAWAVTYGDAAVARLWDLSTGALRAELIGHRHAVSAAVAVGAWLVTVDESGTIAVWDPATGERRSVLPFEELNPGVIARGDHLVTFGAGRPRVWQLAPEVPLRRVPLHQARIRELTFDRAGTALWTAANDGTARRLDLATGAVRVFGAADYVEPAIRSLDDGGQFHNHARGLRSLRLSPDETRVATAREDGAVTLWDVATGTELATWPHPGRARRVVFTRDGARAFVAAGTGVYAWEVATGRALGHAELGGPAWDVALLGDEQVLATQTNDRAALWDAATLTPRANLRPFPDRLRELIVADDRLVAAAPDSVLVIDRDGQVHGRAEQEGAFAAAVSPAPARPPHGRLVAVGTPSGEVVLRDAADAAPIRSWRIDDGLAALAFRPDGALLASAGGRRVRVWDPATGRQLLATPELPALVTQLAWSPDGRALAFGGGSGVVYLWTIAAPVVDAAALARCVAPWRLDGSGLAAAAFDPDACAGVLPGL